MNGAYQMSIERFHANNNYGLTGVTLTLAGFDASHSSAVVRLVCDDCGKVMTVASTDNGAVRWAAHCLNYYHCNH
jgi:hypothetical protein